MKRLWQLLFLIIIFPDIGFNQGIINNFLYGYTGVTRCNMDLFSGTPLVTCDTTYKYRLHQTLADISDSSGNLLFFTNGITVFDGNIDTMPNGRGLNPCALSFNFRYEGLHSSQADLILPDPGNFTRYYLFHQSLDQYPQSYYNMTSYYSIIDMTLNNGKGDVINKNTVLFQDSLEGVGTTACKHANGRDWWVVFLRANLPVYFVYLLTPTGIQYHSTQTVGSRWSYGQTAFSPDGSHYGIREFMKNFQVFDFDRCNGNFTNARIVPIDTLWWGQGLCFSPNSKLVYASSLYNLFQANLDSANLVLSLDTVAKWDSTYSPWPPWATTFEFMQRGPDGKIYMTTQSSTFSMHVIEHPDSAGPGCNLLQHDISLFTFNDNSIPNFVNYALGPVMGSICDSLGLGIPKSTLHDFKFIIQPNPIIDKTLHCKYVLPQNTPGILEVFDLTGRILSREPLPEWSTEQHIKLKLTAGIYVVKILSNRQQSVQKIVIP